MNAAPSPLRKIFWLVVMPLLWLFAVKAIALRSYDKPVDFVQPTADALPGPDAPLVQDGAMLDRRALFDVEQDAEILPCQDDGMRDVLAALGPRALAKDDLADDVPWDQFPTDERSKDWYDNVWTPLCQKLELDPSAKPGMLDRPALESALAKSAPGKSVEEIARRLESNPWQAAKFPAAATWIADSADLYALFADALRKPKFCAPRKLIENVGQIDRTELIDLAVKRKIARYFLIRANLRIAEGKISGAIDDAESILRLARFGLDSNVGFPTDRLVALGALESALSIGLFANPSAQPSREEIERWNDLWSELFAEYDFEAALVRAQKTYYDFVLFATAQDLCKVRRTSGKIQEALESLQANAPVNADDSKPKKSFYLFRSSFDEQFLFETLDGLLKRRQAALAQGEKFEFDPQEEIKAIPGAKNRTTELNFAFSIFNASIDQFEKIAKEFRRVACMAQMRTIVGGVLAYQQDHGELPPAYSLDPTGKPGLSWRVLILPYLGEKNRALYERFKLDEPWNSDANKALAETAPECYRCPALFGADSGATPYAVILGQDALFGYGGVARNLDALRKRPGVYTHLQALVVERKQASAWTRPDAELDAHECRETIGKEESVFATLHTPDGVNVASASGAVCTRSVKPAAKNASPADVAEVLISGK